MPLIFSETQDFPGGAVVKNPPANAGDMGQALVREDPTCRGVTKPMHHNYWACALEPMSLEPMLHNLKEKPTHRDEE